MNVLGLDLSLTSTGVAYCDGSTTTWTTKTTGVERLVILRDTLTSILDGGVVDLVAIENYAFGRPNQAAHLGELGGVIRVRLWEHGVPYVEIPPANLKMYATGRGNASKDEVLVSAVRRLGYAGASNDEADASFLRVMALDHYGLAECPMPATHRRALDKIVWPILYTEGLTPPVAVRP